VLPELAAVLQTGKAICVNDMYAIFQVVMKTVVTAALLMEAVPAPSPNRDQIVVVIFLKTSFAKTVEQKTVLTVLAIVLLGLKDATVLANPFAPTIARVRVFANVTDLVHVPQIGSVHQLPEKRIAVAKHL